VGRFSETELKHLGISILVMSALVAYVWGMLNVMGIVLALVVIAPAFALHELGHKFAAQKYGFPAEYRMWTQGLLLAVFVVLISGGKFLFIAPGAVYFVGRHASKEHVGKIGAAGPLINLLLAVAFGLVGLMGGALTVLGQIGMYVNAFLALFNSIPFGMFDGRKIFAWNKVVWGAILGMSIVLYWMSAVG